MNISNSALEDIKFNADRAIEDQNSIYSSEFFLSLDEVFGTVGDYDEPVQAKAISYLIGEVIRLRDICEKRALRVLNEN
ncbi:hypothetical protein A71_156 [Escherichia phage A7_1]|uniref:Uncharacterized protein n=1 Tax=Escherichia phage A5-4 TaxID=2996162 RepID=A0AAE9PW97_9CAUD|nr:hypothetical protein A71_156 [Escherichia phage A7_1]UZZ64236.1 hypothetical protein A54_272 [Escherichia phage A5-4]